MFKFTRKVYKWAEYTYIMKRKLVKQGDVTLMASLPATWIKSQGLKNKDEVIISEQGDELIIRSVMKNSKINLKVKNNEEHNLSWMIRSAYLKGFSEITLNFEKTPKLKELNNIVNFFTGLEIVENNGEVIKIKNFVQDDTSQLENLIVKQFQIIKVMLDQIKKNWQKIDLENLYSTRMMTYRLRDHCLRMSRSTAENFENYSFLWELQNIANKIYYLASDISKCDIKKSKLIPELEKTFERAYNAYLKKEVNFSNENLKSYHKELKRLSSNNIRKLFSKEDPLLAFHYGSIMTDLSIICNRIIHLSK